MKKKRKLSKENRITIPSVYRKKMNMERGEWVHVIPQNKQFIVKKYEEGSTENTMTLGKDGLFTVPIEVMRELKIKPNSEFEVEMISDRELVYVTK